jgi:hypothetical protein
LEDKDSEVVDEDNAGKMKRRTDAHDNLDIEDESSDSDMVDTFSKEYRKIIKLVAKRRAQEAAADPSRNKEEDGSWEGRKELNRHAQDGAADPSSNEEDRSWKRRKELNRCAQDGTADASSDKEDGRRKRRKESNRHAQDGAADPSSDKDNKSRKQRMELNLSRTGRCGSFKRQRGRKSKMTQGVDRPCLGWCDGSFKQQQQHNSNSVEASLGEE